MSRAKSLNVLFKAATPARQKYILALESENLKLHKQIAKLQAQDITKQHQITALQREMKELTKKHRVSLHINLGDTKKPDAPDNASSQGAAK